jgi:hypothetical protein
LVSHKARKLSITEASFLIVLVVSIVALLFQSYIHAETYATLNNVEVGVRRVAVRFVEGHVETNLTLSISNPSSVSRMLLKSIQMTTYLNGERLRYTSGQFFYLMEIPSGGSTTVILRFRVIVDDEILTYRNAQETGMWNWFFDASAIVVVAFKEARIDASGDYQGVQIIS